MRAEHRLRRRVGSEVRDRHRRHDLRDHVHRPASQPRRRLQLRHRDIRARTRRAESHRRYLDRCARRRPDGPRVGRYRGERPTERGLSLERQRRHVQRARPQLGDDLLEERARRADQHGARLRPATRSRHPPPTSFAPTTPASRGAARGRHRRWRTCNTARRRSCWSPRSIRRTPTSST